MPGPVPPPTRRQQLLVVGSSPPGGSPSWPLGIRRKPWGMGKVVSWEMGIAPRSSRAPTATNRNDDEVHRSGSSPLAVLVARSVPDVPRQRYLVGVLSPAIRPPLRPATDTPPEARSNGSSGLSATALPATTKPLNRSAIRPEKHGKGGREDSSPPSRQRGRSKGALSGNALA